jgi:hypothetical protein
VEGLLLFVHRVGRAEQLERARLRGGGEGEEAKVRLAAAGLDPPRQQVLCIRHNAVRLLVLGLRKRLIGRDSQGHLEVVGRLACLR